jgi:hypothetical protein
MATLKFASGYLQPQTWPGTSNCPPLPPCPACGGLQCLCRPRFFAGQVLTEADLNRLEQYVIDKNRLHNRYLHGWGVVCGLEVGCHPCGDRVTVKAGYALSPCGDDIIVCADDTALVCELMRKCRPASPTYPDCTPQTSGDNSDCQNLTEDWILAICYNETPLRGVTTLRDPGSTGCACCSCGGSAAAGCGCGGGGKSGSKKGNGGSKNGCSTSPKTPPPACEPTLMCEGYTFIVYKAPPPPSNDQSRLDAKGLTSIVNSCKQNLIKDMPQKPTGGNVTPGQLQQWCCALKQWLSDLLIQVATSQCVLFDRLGGARCPDASRYGNDVARYEHDMAQALIIYGLVFAALLRDCICNSLLPQCPPPVDCNCVPLATLSVRLKDCKVLSVCNWAAREFVLTFPDIIAWLEPTKILDLLRQLIEHLCCGVFQEREFLLRGGATNAAAPPSPASATAGGSGTIGGGVTQFATLLSQAWANADQGRVIDAGTLALAYLGATDTQGNPLASQFEMDNPLAFLAINQILRPTLQSVLPAEWAKLMATLASSQGSSGAPTPDDLATLRKAVDDLRATVQRQADEINRLKTK